MVMPAAIFMRFLSDAGMEKNIHMRGNIGNSSPKRGAKKIFLLFFVAVDFGHLLLVTESNTGSEF